MYCKPTRCQRLVHFYFNLTTVLHGPYFYGQIGRVKISGLESLSTLRGTTVRWVSDCTDCALTAEHSSFHTGMETDSCHHNPRYPLLPKYAAGLHF